MKNNKKQTKKTFKPIEYDETIFEEAPMPYIGENGCLGFTVKLKEEYFKKFKDELMKEKAKDEEFQSIMNFLHMNLINTNTNIDNENKLE